jgi:hypothetical protein
MIFEYIIYILICIAIPLMIFGFYNDLDRFLLLRKIKRQLNMSIDKNKEYEIVILQLDDYRKKNDKS